MLQVLPRREGEGRDKLAALGHKVVFCALDDDLVSRALESRPDVVMIQVTLASQTPESAVLKAEPALRAARDLLRRTTVAAAGMIVVEETQAAGFPDVASAVSLIPVDGKQIHYFPAGREWNWAAMVAALEPSKPD